MTDSDAMNEDYIGGRYDEEFLRLYANQSLPPFYFPNMTVYGGNGVPPQDKNFVLTIKVQIIFYMVYSIIFSIGMFGNCLVIYAVLHNKVMQNVTNYFILNLALSDILLCALCVPFTPLYTFLGRWVFGKVMCHLVNCAQAASIYISSLTLTAIAIDRFVVIIYPFRSRMRTCTCLAIICVTWLFSVIATVPYAYFVEHRLHDERPDGSATYACIEDFPEHIRLTFGTITAVLQFVVPFLIMTAAYTLISLRLSSRARAKPGRKSARREQADRERKRRTNRMLIAMVAVFGLSWLPLNFMNLLDDISSNLSLGWERWDYFHLFFFLSHAIAMSSTCYNPFLYAWLNDTFRKEFKAILPCFQAGEEGVGGGSCRGGGATALEMTTATVTRRQANGAGRLVPRSNNTQRQLGTESTTPVHALHVVGTETVVLLTTMMDERERRDSIQTNETAADHTALVTDL